MAIARSTKEDFVKLRVLDEVPLDDCAEQLGVGSRTVRRWVSEPWFAEMEDTIRRARNQAIEESARESVRENKTAILSTQTEWDTKRRSYIQRMRDATGDLVQAYENACERIMRDCYDDPRDYKNDADSVSKLADTLRKVLSIDYEEKLAIAAAEGAANQRLTPEEIQMLTPEQLQVLVNDGLQRLREVNGRVIEEAED